MKHTQKTMKLEIWLWRQADTRPDPDDYDSIRIPTSQVRSKAHLLDRIEHRMENVRRKLGLTDFSYRVKSRYMDIDQTVSVATHSIGDEG